MQQPSEIPTTEERLLATGRIVVTEDGRIVRARDGRPCERQLKSGYMQVRLGIDGSVVHGLSHRVVYTFLHGPIPAGNEINHRNGVKTDNQPSNLEACTPSQNISHAHQTGLRHQEGSRNPAAKLTEDEADAIRLRFKAGGITQAQLAREYGVVNQTISKIVLRQRRSVDAPSRSKSRSSAGGAIR